MLYDGLGNSLKFQESGVRFSPPVLFVCQRTHFTLLHYLPHHIMALNPHVDSQLFAANVAAPLQLYQEDPVHQPLGLNSLHLLAHVLTIAPCSIVTWIPVW